MCKAADCGKVYASPPIIASVRLRVANLTCSKLHQHCIRRENSNRCGRKGNNRGCVGGWMVGRPIFSWGETSINFLSLAGGFPWRAPLDCEIRQNYSGRDRWPRRGGVARLWATTKVPPLLPLPTWCTWVNVCARWCTWIYTQEIITEAHHHHHHRGSVVSEGAKDPWDLKVEVGNSIISRKSIIFH